MTPTEWAYLAGFFDGDGCISVAWRKDAANIYPLVFIISNTNEEVIDWCHRRIGGHKHRYDRGESRPYFEVKTSGNVKVPRLLRELLPYLIVKREQVIVALELAEVCDRTRPVGQRPVTSRTERERLRQRLHDLKSIYRARPLLA